jgi:hypothetical protein
MLSTPFNAQQPKGSTLNKIAPDMTGSPARITDIEHLYARIGYRTYLIWSKENPAPRHKGWSPERLEGLKKLYDGYNKREMQRIRELRTAAAKAAKAAKAA